MHTLVLFFQMYRWLVFCLIGYVWSPVWITGQPVETVRVKAVPGPYLRFDPFTVNNEAFKQAYYKQMVLQDSRGYLWFLSEPNAKEQLIRYDGTYYKSFGSEEWITLKENESHELWGLNKKGLCRFDPVSETFHYISDPLLKAISLGSWVMGKNGKNLFQYSNASFLKRPTKPFIEFDSRTRQVRWITPNILINGYTGQAELEKPYTFSPLSTDSTGRVWGVAHSATYNTVGYYDAKRNALVWYPVRGFIAPKFNESGAGPGEEFDVINVIEADGKYVWVGGWNQMGLLRMDTQTGHWKQFYFPETVSNRVFALIRRNDNQFWVKTDTGTLIFDKTTETLQIYAHGPDNDFTPAAAQGSPVLDRNQSLWLGLSDKNNSATLSVLHESKQNLRIKDDTLLHYLTGFRALYKKGHKLYFSYHTTQVNFAEYDEVSQHVKTLYRPPLNGFVEQDFFATLPDAINQTVWLVGVSSVGGLFRLDEKRQLVRPVRAIIQGLPPDENQVGNYDEIRAVVQDEDGNVWFPSYGTLEKYAGTLLKFDSRTKQFVGYRAGTHGLPFGQIRAAMADKEGKIWLGYRGGGPVYRFDPMKNQATVVMKNTHRDGTDAMKIVDDPARNKIWIARFNDGLWQYDRHKNTTRQVLSEPVLSVHLTKNKVIWLKTLTALVRYIPETGQQLRFGAEYDLHAFNWSPFVKTDDDEFFFEKFRFYDQDIKPDTIKPKVLLSFIKVFDKELQLPRSLNHTKQIDLNYDQNFFTVGFSALSYFQSERNQYMYRLVNFNKDWVHVGNKPLAVFSNVPPGDYQLQIKGSNNDGLWSDVKTISIHIIPPFWQTGWFRLLSFIALVIAVVMLYRFQLERRTLKARLEAEEARRKQTEAELNEREAAYQLKLSQTEMAALRSQMNPHFIFNCLNSIQYFTAQNDAEKASDYLTKFSRLIRLVLENSKSEKVTLANELDTLRLYMDMEAMRFPQKLHYRIQIDETVDTESIQLPPLLLQPFVENAIWHGLMHKEEGGTVTITAQQNPENLLHIEITDDGVGRQRAAEYKSKSATKHKSFGMKLTADRIALINQLYQIHTHVNIIDLADAEGRATGTKVIIEIPV